MRRLIGCLLIALTVSGCAVADSESDFDTTEDAQTQTKEQAVTPLCEQPSIEEARTCVEECRRAGGSSACTEICASAYQLEPIQLEACIERCGDVVCGPTTYCCNRSCSICAPEGSACTQQACE